MSIMCMTNVSEVIEVLGGPRDVAVIANVHQVTVERWRKRNRIPKKYHPGLFSAAKRKGVKLPRLSNV